jgi:hypothetical protein
MLTEAKYIEQQRRLGNRLHEHDGVWWREPYRFYAKPVFEFRSFPPKTAKPRLSKSFLGYSHQVPECRYANRILEYMILEGEDLRLFSLARLPTDRRNKVRKGLRLCTVRPITCLETCIEEVRQICISHAKRAAKDQTFPVPFTYYVEHEKEWKAEMLRRFAIGGNEWWGAFHQGGLVSYKIQYQVDNILIFYITKTHTDYLNLCWNRQAETRLVIRSSTAARHGRALTASRRNIFSNAQKHFTSPHTPRCMI